MVVITFENRTNVNQYDVSLRSTPPYCLDMMMCNASDLSGNSGSATWRIGRVTGEYQFHLPTNNVMMIVSLAARPPPRVVSTTRRTAKPRGPTHALPCGT